MTRSIGRRRAIFIAAAAAGLSLTGRGGATSDAAATAYRWRGPALGAEATILLYHPDQAAAERLIGACVAEIARLEAVFSLYRADSALSVLNRAGVLDAPPLDLVRLLADSQRIGRLTDGAFDVTVQPLWRLYAEHFAAPDADPDGPAAAAVASAQALVDHAALDIAGDRVALGRPGMAVTLNGIAQGYITDRVADLLRADGIDSVLLELGEIRALGRRPDGNPWRIGLADPIHPDRLFRSVDLEDQAVATSAAAGTPFDRQGRFHHLFDPATGRCADRYASVSVIAPSATLADALSTALSVTPFDRLQARLERFRPATAILMMPDGSLVTRSA